MPVPPVLHRSSALFATGAALACTLAAASPAPAATKEASFTSPPEIVLDPTSGPEDITLGDFNLDGKQDIAVTDFRNDAVHVRLGNGDGSFKEADSIGGVDEPEALVVGDFNLDGVEDLAVGITVQGNGYIAVLVGLGDGRFSRGQTVSLPNFATSLAVADLNGDGRDDLAATGFHNLSVRLGAANGGFTDGSDVTFSEVPAGVVAADFDGDGNEDLSAVLQGEFNQIATMHGTGDGSFDRIDRSAIPSFALSMVAGDFNGDGREDLAAVNSVDDLVSVRLGKGDGALSSEPKNLRVGPSPTGIAVGDFDSDGREDLAITHAGPSGARNAIAVRLGNGDGSFRDDGDTPVGRSLRTIAAGDFNGDGKEDLAAASFSSHSVALELGSGRAPLAGNLLVNGGFEQGLGAALPSQRPAISGWTVTGGMTFARYGSVPHSVVPSRFDSARFQTGGLNYLWGGNSSAIGGVTTASQDVAVGGSADAIDSGRATANLSAWLGGGGTYADNMSVTASFLDADGSVLGSALQIGPVTLGDRHGVTTLLRRAGSAPVPAGTRRIRVTATSTDNDMVSSATADNLKLTLSIDGANGGGPGGGGGGDTPQPRTTEFGPDTKVKVSLVSRRVPSRGPVRVRVTNGNAFAVPGTLSGRTAAARGAGARKPAKLKSKRFSVAASGRKTVKLALPKKLRRALARNHKLSLRLSAVVTDPSGHRRTIPKRVTLRLKPRPAKRH